MDELVNFNIKKFQHHLIQWFYNNKRSLPWRETTDPYCIWVSEIMLQQTRVDTVIPYYLHFLRKFPTVESLAKAKEDEVLKAWEGLGYYSRASNLQKAAREVVAHYDGNVPKTRKQLEQLQGIGPYTAGAILSIAFNEPAHAVDGNVMRVLSRIFLIGDDITKGPTRKKFEKIIIKIISKDDPSAFNQGLMELGALVCTKSSPGCLLCPVVDHCEAYKKGVQQSFPKRTKRKKQVRKKMAAILIRNEQNEIFIERRPASGLLANLWQFPTIETTGKRKKDVQIKEALQKKYGIQSSIHKPVQTITHAFTHMIWDISLYEITITDESISETDRKKWVQERQLEQFTFPVPYQKMIQFSLKE